LWRMLGLLKRKERKKVLTKRAKQLTLRKERASASRYVEKTEEKET